MSVAAEILNNASAADHIPIVVGHQAVDLMVLKKYNIIICKNCKICVSKNILRHHLLKDHCINLSNKELDNKVKLTLSSMTRLPTHVGAAGIPYLAIIDGFKCSDVNTFANQEKLWVVIQQPHITKAFSLLRLKFDIKNCQMENSAQKSL
jgi:Orsellinic acid/F9775 biosynthesis cluster protein D